MKRNELNLPNPCPLEGTFASVSHEEIEVVDVPMVFVAEDAVPLTTQCMKSHSERGLEDDKRMFNYRLHIYRTRKKSLVKSLRCLLKRLDNQL